MRNRRRLPTHAGSPRPASLTGVATYGRGHLMRTFGNHGQPSGGLEEPLCRFSQKEHIVVMFGNHLYQGHDPFSPAEQEHKPAQRIDVQRHRLEHAKMRTAAFDLEQHILAIHAARIDEALRARQRRETGSQPGRIAAAVTNARAAVGAMLIATGERLREEPRGSQIETNPADAVRHA